MQTLREVSVLVAGLARDMRKLAEHIEHMAELLEGKAQEIKDLSERKEGAAASDG